jgi:hypothetical protein
MFKFFVKVKVVPDQTMAMDEFRFISVKQDKDITEQYRL